VTAMNPIWRARLPLLIGVVAPIGVAAALIPFRNRSANTVNVALVLVAVVVAVAATGPRLAGIVAAISAALGFDFFHTRPFESLNITRRADVETAVLLLVVGLIVGQLATRSQRHRGNALESSADIARIHAVAELVAAGAAPEDVILAVRNELVDLLSLRDCRFTTTFDDRPRPRLEANGEVMMGALQWGVSTMGLPGKEIDLVVHGRGRPHGRFVLVPTPGLVVSWDRRVVAVALADQVGAALAATDVSGLG
jgi:K+-sensing histidine kinase KdpD